MTHTLWHWSLLKSKELAAFDKLRQLSIDDSTGYTKILVFALKNTFNNKCKSLGRTTIGKVNKQPISHKNICFSPNTVSAPLTDALN